MASPGSAQLEAAQQPQQPAQQPAAASASAAAAAAAAAAGGALWWHGPVAGAAAGVLSRAVVFPSDTVKSRLQLQGARGGARPYTSTAHAFRTVWATEGPAAFYRGFSVVAVGVVPANATYFGGYELGRWLVPRGWGLGGDVLVGGLAQLLAGVVFTPLDAIKERMQARVCVCDALAPPPAGLTPGPPGRGGRRRCPLVAPRPEAPCGRCPAGCLPTQRTPLPLPQTLLFKPPEPPHTSRGPQVQAIMGPELAAYRGAGHAVRSALAHAGLRGLLRGYWATNAVWLPWNVLYISAYERLKDAARAALAAGGAPAVTAAAAAADSRGAPAAGASGGAASGGRAASPSSGGRHGRGGPETLPGWAIAGCSATAAGGAAVLTHPADVVKTRLQVLCGTPEGRSLTALQVARQLLAAEGPRALMRGCAARVLTIAPGSALSWGLYEVTKRALGGRSGGVAGGG